MNIIRITDLQLVSFVLVFFRIGAVLFTAPFFSAKNFPARVKAPLSFILAIIMVLALTREGKWGNMLPAPPQNVASLVMLILREAIIGIAIGYTAQLVFIGVQLAGQLVGYGMGFAMMRIMDPTTKANVTVIAQYNGVVAMLVFVIINGHHYILTGIAESFYAVPLGQWGMTKSFAEHLIIIFGNIFSTALKIAIPVMAAVFLTKVALGIVARTMPQMNVFVVGFPLQIGVGLIAMSVSLPLFVKSLNALFATMQYNIWGVFQQ